MRQWIRFVGIGIELVILEASFLYAGQYLDKKYGWNGGAATVGAFLGLTIWFVHLIFNLRALQRDERER